jgi:hypothetical protein
MARPSKYNWDEICAKIDAGMSRPDAIKEYGCPKSSLSEELQKRGITEPDPKKVAVKDAIVSAVKSVSELSEQITEQEKKAIVAVAAHESGHRMILESIMDEANSLALEIMREKRETGELSIAETKQVIEMTSKHVETRYGKITPDVAVQVNNNNNMNQLPTVIEIVAPE